MKASRYVLIVTVGRQDLKCWKAGDAEKVPGADLFPPRMPNKSPSAKGRIDSGKKSTEGEYPSVRKFHESILLKDGSPDPERVRLVESLDDFKKNIGVPEVREFIAGIGHSGEGCVQQARGFSALHDADGRILMNPAKLFPLVGALEDIGTPIQGVVVVHTNRETESDEPIASGPWILKYLAERFNLDSKKARLANSFPLGDNGRLEGKPGVPEDFPVRREIVNQVHNEIASFASLFDEAVIPAVVGTGGIGPLKDIVRAEVDLVFDHPPVDLSIPEDGARPGEREEWRRVVERILRGDVISRVDAISARARALDLARRGDFTGAWASVARQSQSGADRYWLIPLQQVSTYFGGPPTQLDFDQNKVTHDIESVLHHIELQVPDQLDRYSRFALNAAFRMEAALQGGERDIRLVDALVSLCTLIDVLVLARACQLIDENRLPGLALDRATGKVVKGRESDKFDALVKSGLVDKKKMRVTASRDGWFFWKFNTTDNPFEEIKVLDSALRIKPGEQQKREAENHLRMLRNLATHQALNTKQVKRIHEVAQDHGIWRLQSGVSIGGRALFKGGLIDRALASATVKDAESQYRTLIEDGLLGLLRDGSAFDAGRDSNGSDFQSHG